MSRLKQVKFTGNNLKEIKNFLKNNEVDVIGYREYSNETAAIITKDGMHTILKGDIVGLKNAIDIK